MKRILNDLSGIMILGLAVLLCGGQAPGRPFAEEPARPVSVLVLLGEWFGDAYFPLKEEIEARGWTMKRVGVDVEYRGCYNKKRDVGLRGDILIPEMRDFAGYDCLIIPSGPQFRKFKENPAVLKFVRDAHAAGLLVASFCVGNFLVQAAGLVDGISGLDSFPGKVTMARERVLLGPRGGGPPPGYGFKSAPIKEICDAIAKEVAKSGRDADRLAEPGEKRANEVQPPELVMDILGIRPGLIVGEVGAGRGRLTVHLAARVGDKGRVYANDIDPAAVDYLKARCQRQGLTNVETILSLPDDARFPQKSLDLIVMCYVYHHVDNPVPLLKSLLSSLKPWGIVAFAEPKPEHTETRARALTRELVGKEAQAAGFTLDSVIEDRFKADNLFILRPAVPDAPESHDRRKVRALWLEYLAWTKTAQGRTSPRDYAVGLEAKGIPGPEIRRRLQVIRSQFTEQPEGIEMIYDPLYGKPLTGDLDKDGFKTSPNAFLVEAMKGIKPGGEALDVGAGMGRNAIHLAGLGWIVTGIDLSAKGLAVMQANAEKAGLKVRTVKTSYEDFDFGRERWDLVAMILSWAPIEDPGFLARLKASIRPGGYIVFEHVVQRSENPFPPGVHALAPGALRGLFQDFEILTYREQDHSGDWGGPPTPHVWMVARTRG